VKEEHMRATLRWAVGLTFALLIIPGSIPSQAQTTNELRPPASFESIADQNARSRALFSEIAKVLNSPRCINCHPRDPELPLAYKGEQQFAALYPI
jgi:hypothetical protein